MANQIPESKVINLKEMYVDINRVRVALADQMRQGVEEMSIDAIIRLIHKSYKEQQAFEMEN